MMSYYHTAKKVKTTTTNKPTKKTLANQEYTGPRTSRGVKTPCQKCMFRQQEHTGGLRSGKYTGKFRQLGPLQFGTNSPAFSPGFFLSASLINAN